MNDYERENLGRLRGSLPGCTVLLKKNGAFPLEGPCRIEAVGSGVRYTVKGGTGSGEVNSRYYVNIEDGLKSAGFSLTNPFWSEMYGIFRKNRSVRINERKMNCPFAGSSVTAPP